MLAEARSVDPTSETSSSDVVARPREDDRLPVLDGLRGLAILMVTVVHLASAEVDPGLETGTVFQRLYAALAVHGTAGVDLFFVLSGFLITRILLRTRDRPHYLRNFYARRVLRIFPLYYLALALVFFVLIPFVLPPRPEHARLAGEQSWLWLYASNIAQSFYGVRWRAGSVNLTHFWSLAVEEHFYLVWPFLVLLLRPRGLLAICVGLIFAAVVMKLAFLHAGMTHAAYVFTGSRADALALGAALAVLARERGGLAALRPLARRLLIGSVVLMGLLAALRLRDHPWWTTALTHSIYPPMFAAILVLGLVGSRRGFVTRCLEGRFLGFFGRYSYGLYMWHALLVPAFIVAIPPAALQRAVGSRMGGLLAFYLVSLSLSCVAALISWHLFEKHFLKLKHAFD
jgi:peptidoglycan/LPS O-acetylase OafA/YrhL